LDDPTVPFPGRSRLIGMIPHTSSKLKGAHLLAIS